MKFIFVRCSECIYWRKFPAFTAGTCHLWPPEVIADGESRWPTTEENDWCARGRSGLVQIGGQTK